MRFLRRQCTFFAVLHRGLIALLINLALRHPHGFAVERRVVEQLGCADVVDDGEPELAVLLRDARAAPDDLLEIHHRVDRLEQHDVAAGGRIHAGGQHLRGGQDDRHVLLGVLEVIQVAASDLFFIRYHPGDVVGMLFHQVGIAACQAHCACPGRVPGPRRRRWSCPCGWCA